MDTLYEDLYHMCFCMDLDCNLLSTYENKKLRNSWNNFDQTLYWQFLLVHCTCFMLPHFSHQETRQDFRRQMLGKNY
jgi:hypothetical protein